MGINEVLTKLSIVFGTFGVLSWFIASLLHWTRYGVPRLSAADWMMDAGVLVLIAIWLKLGAIYHQSKER